MVFFIVFHVIIINPSFLYSANSELCDEVPPSAEQLREKSGKTAGLRGGRGIGTFCIQVIELIG
jgi:hypothetical protein